MPSGSPSDSDLEAIPRPGPPLVALTRWSRLRLPEAVLPGPRRRVRGGRGVRAGKGQASCFELSVVDVAFVAEQDAPAADVLVLLSGVTGVPAVAGEFLVGARKEVVALCLVLAYKQDVGRVTFVRESGGPPFIESPGGERKRPQGGAAAFCSPGKQQLESNSRKQQRDAAGQHAASSPFLIEHRPRRVTVAGKSRYHRAAGLCGASARRGMKLLLEGAGVIRSAA